MLITGEMPVGVVIRVGESPWLEREEAPELWRVEARSERPLISECKSCHLAPERPAPHTWAPL